MILNEHDKHAAQWLRNLIAAGHLPPGVVDDRDIQELKADDLRPHKRVHLFAGIAGWELALQLAGWPEDRPVWTGSCPCQPFSSAGKRKGTDDERHLWPEMFRLIRECRPDCIVGEQVASAVGHGWLDGVFADLEGEGYSCGAVVLGAHSVGAPHIRQRLYWVSVAQGGDGRLPVRRGRQEQAASESVGGGKACWLSDRASPRRNGAIADAEGQARVCVPGVDREAGGVQHAEGDGRQQGRAEPDGRGVTSGCGVGGVCQSIQSRLEGLAGNGDHGGGWTEQAGSVAAAGAWSDFTVLPFRDGKHRRIPVEPALFPLAHGVPGRVGLLRGAGNAIVPQVAAEFVKAYMECEPCN